MRYLVLVALVGCSKTAAEKKCDAIFDLLDTCGAQHLSFAMRHSANEYCTITLGYDDPKDTTSLAADARRALDECSAATSCEPLRQCLDKHGCSWISTRPDDTTPSFMCMH